MRDVSWKTYGKGAAIIGATVVATSFAITALKWTYNKIKEVSK